MTASPNVCVAKLAAANADTLCEGLQLLNAIDQQQFTASCKPVFESTIGAHFRHFLEHYLCLFNQLELGEVRYDSRKRDPKLETELHYTCDTLQQIIGSLKTVSDELDPGNLLVRDSASTDLVPSTLARELLFLQSHSLHHFAIIAAMTRSMGIQTCADFGVAISTREHNHSECNGAEHSFQGAS